MAKAHWNLTAYNLAPRSAREALRGFCADIGLGEAATADVLLCVTEAVTNAVLHAYIDLDEPGRVELEVYVDDHLCVTVRDAGHGLRPRHDSPGLGLGLPVISEVADHFEVRTPATGGTEVVMKFALA